MVYPPSAYAYGGHITSTNSIPWYQEGNSALFTAAVFPFSFGVMYGDVGQGTFLFLAGVAMHLSPIRVQDSTSS